MILDLVGAASGLAALVTATIALHVARRPTAAPRPKQLWELMASRWLVQDPRDIGQRWPYELPAWVDDLAGWDAESQLEHLTIWHDLEVPLEGDPLELARALIAQHDDQHLKRADIDHRHFERRLS